MAGTRWVVGSWSNPEIKSTSGAIGRGSHALLAHGRWVSAQKCKTVRNESRARALATTLHSSHGTGRVGVDTVRLVGKARELYSTRFDAAVDGGLPEACVTDVLRMRVRCTTGTGVVEFIQRLCNGTSTSHAAATVVC
jgi:hypothetical protein